MATGLTWQTSPNVLATRVDALAPRYQTAVMAIAQLIADEAEAQAKATARWKDRTTQARRGLTGLALRASRDLVVVYLYHKADHGVWLELANGGAYKIIMPTLESLYPRAMALCRRLVGGQA